MKNNDDKDEADVIDEGANPGSFPPFIHLTVGESLEERSLNIMDYQPRRRAYQFRASARHEVPVHERVHQIEGLMSIPRGQAGKKMKKKKKNAKNKKEVVKTILETLEEVEAEMILNGSNTNRNLLPSDSSKVFKDYFPTQEKSFLDLHQQYTPKLSSSHEDVASNTGRSRRQITIRRRSSKKTESMKESTDGSYDVSTESVDSNLNFKNVAPQKPRRKYDCDITEQDGENEKNQNIDETSTTNQDSASKTFNTNRDDNSSKAAKVPKFKRKFRVSRATRKSVRSQQLPASLIGGGNIDAGGESAEDLDSDQPYRYQTTSIAIKQIQSGSSETSSPQNEAERSHLKSPLTGNSPNRNRNKSKKVFSPEKYRERYFKNYLEAEEVETNLKRSDGLNSYLEETNKSDSTEDTLLSDEKEEEEVEGSLIIHEEANEVSLNPLLIENLKADPSANESPRKRYREKYLAKFLEAASPEKKTNSETKNDVIVSDVTSDNNPVSDVINKKTQMKKKRPLKKALSYGGEKSFQLLATPVVEKRSFGVQTDESYFQDDCNKKNKESSSPTKELINLNEEIKINLPKTNNRNDRGGQTNNEKLKATFPQNSIGVGVSTTGDLALTSSSKSVSDQMKLSDTDEVEFDGESSGDEYVVEYIDEINKNRHKWESEPYSDASLSDCDEEIVVYVDDQGQYTDEDGNPTELVFDSDDDVIYIEY